MTIRRGRKSLFQCKMFICELGAAHELSIRYGDYFTASRDPSIGSMIWVAGEYHSTATWSTYIGQLNTVKQSLKSAPLR